MRHAAFLIAAMTIVLLAPPAHAKSRQFFCGDGSTVTVTVLNDQTIRATPIEGRTMTLRQTGGALGVALLGSLLAEGYASRVNTAGLPPEAAAAARESIAGALAAGTRLGEPSLASSANAAYLHGMSLVLIATAITAGLSAVLTALLLPGKPTAGSDHDPRSPHAPAVADKEGQ